MAVQMAQVWNAVSEQRTARASGVPIGREHEVVNDELWAAVEEFGQAHFLAVFVGEGVVRGDFDDWEIAALTSKGITVAGVLLLCLKESQAERQVLIRSGNLYVM